MKIKANKLVTFLEKLSLKGKINTCVLNFKEDGIQSMVMTRDVAFVEGFMGKEQFDDYEAIGEIGIKSNSILTNLLKRYGNNTVKLEIQENKLVIVSETGSTFFVLCDKKNIDNHTETPLDISDKLDKEFELEVEKLSSIKQGADTIKAEQLIIEIKDNKLTMMVETDVGDKITEETDIEFEDVKCEYGDLLMNVIDVITGKVRVAMKTNFPIMIICGNFKFIVAPLVKGEDD